VNGQRDFRVPDTQNVASTDGADDVEIRKLAGISIVDFSERQINSGDTLLGNRWLCRGAGAFIVGPSGVGKSTQAIQMAAEFACGRASFDITPAGPLRVLVIQAEDDEGDVIEMSMVVNHLGLTKQEKDLVRKNTVVEHVNDLYGEDFILVLDQYLDQWPADIVIINPYESYLGDDIQDRRANTEFLRNSLNPLLERHRCGCIIVHHTPKTNFRDTTKWKDHDWMYAAAGAAGLTNWARGMIVIDPTDVTGVYRLICPKRGERIGWTGLWQYWAHSGEEGKLLWIPANAEQRAGAQKLINDQDAILSLFPEAGSEPITQARLFSEAKTKYKMGVNRVRNTLRLLIDDEWVGEREVRRARSRPEKAYIKTPIVKPARGQI
jgi:hypothetical protein